MAFWPPIPTEIAILGRYLPSPTDPPRSDEFNWQTAPLIPMWCMRCSKGLDSAIHQLVSIKAATEVAPGPNAISPPQLAQVTNAIV